MKSLVFVLAFLAIPASAQEAPIEDEEPIILIFDEDDTTEPELPTQTFVPQAQVRGSLANELALDTQFDGNDEHVFRSFHRLSLAAEMDLNENVKVMVSGRATYWLYGREEGMDRYEFEPELRDTYVHWSAPHIVDGAVGLQTWSWGVSDVFSTADTLNPRDLRHGISSSLETPKIPIFGLSLYRNLGDTVQLEAVWVPFFEPDRVSVMGTDCGIMGSAGSAESGAGLAGLTGLLGGLDPSIIDDIDPLLLSTSRPDEGLENSSAGLRATTTLGTVDIGASYIFGWDRTPILRFDPCLPTAAALLEGNIPVESLDTNALAGLFINGETGLEEAPGTCSNEALIEHMFKGELDLLGLLETKYVRSQVVGLDLTAPIGDVIGKIESSYTLERVFYTQTFESQQHPLISSTAGLEYTYDTSLTLASEFNHQHILGLEEDTVLFLQEQDQLQVALIGNFRFLEYDALEIQLAGLYGITLEDWIGQASIGYRFTDTYLLQLGGRLFGGEMGSPGHLYNNNDEIYLLSQLSF